MASYSIEVSATAEKQLRRLPRNAQIRILRAVQRLQDDPLPRGCRKLKGYEHTFRLRVGTYRILYSIEAERLLILVLKVGQRKDIYR